MRGRHGQRRPSCRPTTVPGPAARAPSRRNLLLSVNRHRHPRLTPSPLLPPHGPSLHCLHSPTSAAASSSLMDGKTIFFFFKKKRGHYISKPTPEHSTRSKQERMSHTGSTRAQAEHTVSLRNHVRPFLSRLSCLIASTVPPNPTSRRYCHNKRTGLHH